MYACCQYIVGGANINSSNSAQSSANTLQILCPIECKYVESQTHKSSIAWWLFILSRDPSLEQVDWFRWLVVWLRRQNKWILPNCIDRTNNAEMTRGHLDLWNELFVSFVKSRCWLFEPFYFFARFHITLCVMDIHQIMLISICPVPFGWVIFIQLED